jgi:hypothetical protein
MSRPRKGQHAIAHKVVELMRDFNNTKKKHGKSVRLSLLPKNEARALLANAVGVLLCAARDQAQLLRRIADVLEGKSLVVPADDMLDMAYKNAQAALNGMFSRDRPTFNEFADEYYKLTGRNLARREAKRYSLHSDRRGAPHGKRKRKPPVFRQRTAS